MSLLRCVTVRPKRPARSGWIQRRVYWPLPDPTRLADPALIDAEFAAVFNTLESRLQRLLFYLHDGGGTDEALDCLHLLNSEA